MAPSAPLDAVPLWHRARLDFARAKRYRPWHSGHLGALMHCRDVTRRDSPYGDDVHLAAAAGWLARAQDASPEGGIVGRYRMKQGWTSAYPETTGYIVPTLLALAADGDDSYRRRAERAIAFLLGTQLDSGAFPAGEIAANTVNPSPFNTAQIINGLLAWSAASGDTTTLEAARRAGDWLVSVQDADGAWRKWYYLDTPACYSAHLACWLADLAAVTGDAAQRAAVERGLAWIMARHVPANGWFEATGFTAAEQELRIADLHTIGYTLAGLLGIAAVLERDDVIDAVTTAAGHLGQTLDRLGWLPGVLDHEWCARADSACLTGNVQMALVWLRLAGLRPRADWRRWADTAIELVKAAQLVDSPNPGLRGGIPGCTPMWGWYNDGAVLSWSAKFFIDALLARRRSGA
jgi:hypothetical protein